MMNFIEIAKKRYSVRLSLIHIFYHISYKEWRCMILNPKLLIVDDERGIVDMIQSYFQTRYDTVSYTHLRPS